MPEGIIGIIGIFSINRGKTEGKTEASQEEDKRVNFGGYV